LACQSLLGPGTSNNGERKISGTSAHRATHGHADHFVDQALAIRQSHELRETKYMIDVVDAADPSA
jgi:L-ascorbate metabolism protein UlaG (beta-lactamase superfamily)